MRSSLGKVFEGNRLTATRCARSESAASCLSTCFYLLIYSGIMMSPSPQALLPKKRDEGERAPVRREGLGALGLHLLFWELGAVGWGGP